MSVDGLFDELLIEILDDLTTLASRDGMIEWADEIHRKIEQLRSMTALRRAVELQEVRRQREEQQ